MAFLDHSFKDRNLERHMVVGRVRKIVSFIEENYLYGEKVKLGGFKFRDGQSTIDKINEGEWVDFDTDNDYWGYRECYCWFKHSFTIPESFAGKPVIYEIKPVDDKWYARNAGFIVYSDDKLLQGLDCFHHYLKLLDCAKGGEKLNININAYADDFEWKGRLRMTAHIKTLNETARRIMYDLSVPLKVADILNVENIARINILNALNEAVNMLDMTDEEDVERFNASALKAIEYLDKEIYSKPNSEMTASCIGHTHIDVAWLWRLRQTRDKAGRSFSTVLKLMDEYPEYKFMSPQAQLYDYVKQDYPELFEKIKQRVRDGRWEVEGSMWVESDTNITSGESLVRQFLVGKRFFRQEFGVDNKIMWLPDVFGYSAALPQIIKKSGLDYFMTTKISWSEFDSMPFDTFMWKGIDGTEVLTHFSPTMAYEYFQRRDNASTYNANLTPSHVVGGWMRYSQKDLNKEYLISFGWGDGGGGPTVEMLEEGRRMARGIEGCPVVEQKFAGDFFRKLEKDVKDNKHLPKWAGELYLEFHRGTLTSQGRNKRYNRKSEVLYHDVETLNQLAAVTSGSKYPAEDILEAWKIILLNQFHDIIPGSSIKAVYEDSREQYEEIGAKGRELVCRALSDIVSDISVDKKSFVVFNTLGMARDDIVITDVPVNGTFSVRDSDGNALPSQLTHDGKLIFFAKDIPAKGFKVYEISADGADCANGVKVEGKKVDNKFFNVEFDKDMNIARLLHKQTGRAVAPEGEVLNRLFVYEDRPFNHEAWDIKAYYDEKYEPIDNVDSVEVIETGAVRTVMRVVRKYLASTIQQDFIFYNDIPRIDVEYVIDWKEKHMLLKTDYPVDVNTTKATYDIQFGNYERPTHANTSWDHAKFEVAGHKWADLSDNSFGLSILNDCKYGWAIRDGHIRPTLLRCATNPNSEQDREVHYFTYSIYPHAGSVDTSNVVEEGYSLNYPLYCTVAEPHAGKLSQEYSLVSADKSNVIIETVKKAEDSDETVIRMYETWNRKTPVKLTFALPIKSAKECNLLEEEDVDLAFEGSSLELTFKPFEIKTIKIRL
ncbi:MAG: alpha-mannosidase [Clostridiales bacterium]|nr:alpha-mannosidase [Clostridiales bacterium]